MDDIFLINVGKETEMVHEYILEGGGLCDRRWIDMGLDRKAGCRRQGGLGSFSDSGLG